jgi:hypothetical protein
MVPPPNTSIFSVFSRDLTAVTRRTACALTAKGSLYDWSPGFASRLHSPAKLVYYWQNLGFELVL